MKIVNIHKRELPISKDKVLNLFSTLASDKDKIWPSENWPPMRFKEGLKKGSIGGHGPIRYEIINFDPNGCIAFKFLKPKGFNGLHKFEITAISQNSTDIKHSIIMTTSVLGTFKWIFAIKWLHDALLEDALDKIENQLTHQNLNTEWHLWVKLLRGILK